MPGPYFEMDDTGELGDSAYYDVRPEYSALGANEIVGCDCDAGMEEDPAVDDVWQGDLGYVGRGLPSEMSDEVGRGLSRFDRLSQQLRARGARDPRGLAAWIGRRKYGAEEFHRMGLRGRGLL